MSLCSEGDSNMLTPFLPRIVAMWKNYHNTSNTVKHLERCILV